MSPRRKPSRALRRIVMRPASRAPAPVVWACWAAPTPARCVGTAAGGFLNERAGTTRAAGRATEPASVAGKIHRVGRSVCCLTASCISTFGAPMKTPGAGEARPCAIWRGEPVIFAMRALALSPACWPFSGNRRARAVRYRFAQRADRCATSARNCRSVRRYKSAGWQSRSLS